MTLTKEEGKGLLDPSAAINMRNKLCGAADVNIHKEIPKNKSNSGVLAKDPEVVVEVLGSAPVYM